MKKVFRVKGWSGLSTLAIVVALVLVSSWAFAFEVQVAEAPMNDLSLAVAAIKSAQQSLLVNIYELSSAEITDAILNRIQAGVRVEIIEEGQPVGGLSAAARGIQGQLAQAMQAHSGDHLFEMASQNTKIRRFRFDHAKYAVIDNAALLIGSENYSPTGNPVPGTLGNRGWEVVIHDPAMSQSFASLFAGDSSTSYGDVTDLVSSNGGTGATSLFAGVLSSFSVSTKKPPSNHHPLPQPVPQPQPPVPNVPGLNPAIPGRTVLEASAAQMITSPDTSLSGLESAINQARVSIDVEQMTFDSAWGPGGRNPLVDDIIAAARRGVKVRVLLNDEVVFNHPGKPSKPKNVPTADLFNQTATQENLNMSARIANIKAMGVDYIHNKGLLLDGDKTLISSINWDENSIEHNRESAVLITSPEVNAHYEALFEKDWQVSASIASEGGLQALSLSTLQQNGSLAVSDVDCPDNISLTVKIRQLTIKDSEDQDFSSLSNRRIQSDFSRVRSTRGCVYSEKDAASDERSADKQYFQVRTLTDGTITLIFEGYTPNTSKLYSIRARLASDSAIDGEHAAVLFDGSGPSRERLGQAVFSLREGK